MINFFKKYKYTIAFNLLIIISYILISTTVDLFGIDDMVANSYGKGLGFVNTINHIINRAYNWNIRIGEILYFIVGAAPRWVYFFLNSLMVDLFFNLTFIFVFGSKSQSYFNTKNHFITLLSNYILSLTLFPGYSEIFIWMAGAFNHMWDIIILLIAAIPFRLLFDGVNIFKYKKKLLIPYYTLCFVSGFSVENAVPWLIVYMFVISVLTIIRRSFNKFQVISLCITSLAFGIMTIFNSTVIRIKFFKSLSFAGISFSELLNCLKNDYIYLFIYIGVLSIILLIMNLIKHNKSENKLLLYNFIQLLISSISLFVIYFSPYFAYRITTLFFFFSMSYNTYLLSNLLNKELIMNIFIGLEILLIIFLTIRIKLFYIDFEKFNSIRNNFIIEVFNNTSQDYYEDGILVCPQYDNKYNYVNTIRLTSIESLYCDGTYLKYIIGIDDEYEFNVIKLGPDNLKIR